jgi:uncharacterized protein YjbI with pentapeptide repeats
MFRLVIALALLISFAASAEASCQNGPAPNVDWTGCSKLMLLLDGENLAGGFFTKALLTGTDFSGATLIAARFDEAGVSRARFQGADLSGSSVTKVVDWPANFSNADLTNVIFSDAGSGALTSRDIIGRAFDPAKNPLIFWLDRFMHRAASLPYLSRPSSSPRGVPRAG